jgi:hypothetical protein
MSMGSPFSTEFDRCAFLSFEKQLRLRDFLGEHRWSLDVAKAEVTYNGKHVFRVHYLGTESAVTKTWLWADANKSIHCPDEALAACRRVRALGQQLGIDECAQDTLPLVEEAGKPTADSLALVATSLANASCYYRGPHEKGALYFMLKDSRIDRLPDMDLDHFCEAYNEIMWFPGDTKAQLVSYLSRKGYIPYIKQDFSGDELSCTLYTGEQFRFTFKETATGEMQITFSPESAEP